MRSMVEGHGVSLQTFMDRYAAGCPSTTFGGPPPRFGEEL